MYKAHSAAFVLAYILVSGAGCDMMTASRVRSNTEADARELLGTHFPGTRYAVTCAGSDSDKDNYVSCTASAQGAPAAPAHPGLVALECKVRVWTSYDRNCRISTRAMPIPSGWGGAVR